MFRVKKLCKVVAASRVNRSSQQIKTIRPAAAGDWKPAERSSSLRVHRSRFRVQDERRDFRRAIHGPPDAVGSAVRTHAHAAVKYQVKVLSHRPGAVIPCITALHTQGPRCSDYRAETYNSIRPSFSAAVSSVVPVGGCAPRTSCLQTRTSAGGACLLPSARCKYLTRQQLV